MVEERRQEMAEERRQEMAEAYVKNRVSIVTPVRNGESYVSRILNSVLAQTYHDLEMILVDGGSTDGTLSLAETFREQFATKGIPYRVLTGGGTAAAGISRGLPFVTGEFLIWPDADDALENESVEKRVAFLRAHPDYQCVRSLGYYVREETGERVQADESRGDLTNEHLFFPVLYAESFVCCGCYMFRTKPFFEIYPGKAIPDSIVGQNLQMLLPFLYRYPCPTIQEELYRVYVRPGSHSRTPRTERQEWEFCDAYDTLIDTIADICHITDKQEKRLLECGKARMHLYKATKCGHKPRIASANFMLARNGKITYRECARRLVYTFFGI